jgi:NADH:ubiquinone reductase (H+-translocating)
MSVAGEEDNSAVSVALGRARRPRVVVVGAGFGGLAAARHLAHGPLEVVVVDRTNHHLFQPFLYQVATAILSPGEIAPPIRSIFRRQPNVTVMLAEVTDVDLPRREIQLCGADGARRQLGYDYLIVAAGARDSYFGHDEWARHALPMKTLAQAVAVRDRILAAYERAAEVTDPQQRRRWTTFVIVGGGPTGVELAGQLVTLARQLHRDFHRIDTERARIVLVEAAPQLLASFAEPLRDHARNKLIDMGVDVRLGSMAVNVDEDGIDVQAHGGGSERIRCRDGDLGGGRAGLAAGPAARRSQRCRGRSQRPGGGRPGLQPAGMSGGVRHRRHGRPARPSRTSGAGDAGRRLRGQWVFDLVTRSRSERVILADLGGADAR